MLFLALAIQCCLATKNTAEHRRCDYVATHPVNGAKYRYRKSIWVNYTLFLSASASNTAAFDIVYYTELRLGWQGLPEPSLGWVQQSQYTLQVQALQQKYWEEPKYESKR